MKRWETDGSAVGLLRSIALEVGILVLLIFKSCWQRMLLWMRGRIASRWQVISTSFSSRPMDWRIRCSWWVRPTIMPRDLQNTNMGWTDIFDTDRSGSINFQEFEGLYRYIQVCFSSLSPSFYIPTNSSPASSNRTGTESSNALTAIPLVSSTALNSIPPLWVLASPSLLRWFGKSKNGSPHPLYRGKMRPRESVLIGFWWLVWLSNIIRKVSGGETFLSLCVYRRGGSVRGSARYWWRLFKRVDERKEGKVTFSYESFVRPHPPFLVTISR